MQRPRRTLHWLLLPLLLFASQVRAERHVLDVSALQEGHELQHEVTVFRDRRGDLDLDQVRGLSPARFAAAPRAMTFGFTRDVHWLKLEADNASDRAQRWLLQLAYPTIDYVTLYVVHQGGRVETHATGDMLPFATRQVADAAFAFAIDSAAREHITCYLRLQTSGSMRTPLRAWPDITRFLDQQNRHYAIMWMFYGALCVLLLFNLGVYVVIRQREYLIYSALLLVLSFLQLSFAGHTLQLLLPNHPRLANQLLPSSVALVILLIPLYAGAALGQYPDLAHAGRRARRGAWMAVVLLPLTMVSPMWIAVRLALGGSALAVLLSPYLLRQLRARRNPQLKLYRASWWCLILAVPIHALRNADLLPPFPLADWSIQIAITAHGLISSLALATRLKVARDELGGLNEQLSHNVTELRAALAQAEQASSQARRAMQVKDEFVATMSHELRTPLNAIINVPQGLLDDFTELRAARCEACDARYLLDEGESLGPEAACESCHRAGQLQEERVTRYQGEPAQTAHFLRKIERSGKHLLQMVNGVLDISKLEAGRLTLTLSNVALAPLLSEAVDEVSELARSKQVTLDLALSGTQPALLADPLRLKQVLLNLLANAIKFSEPHGSVTLRWRSEPGAELFSVVDHGIGIAPEHHERIFTSFEQVHQGDTRKYGGTGLGLSISRSLVRMHGGELWVESALGRGATFWFRLPHHPELQAVQAAAPGASG